MKTYLYPADLTGCGYYRGIWPALALKAQGYDIEIVSPTDKSRQFQAMMNGSDKMIDVVVPEDADVIWMQRPTHKYLVPAVELMMKKGVTVVIDMDDDLTCIDPKNPAWAMLHPRMGRPEHSWENTTKICQMASYVTVSTPALLKTYASHGRGAVVPNYVPRFFTDLPHNDSTIVGWAGSVHSHPNDLQVMGTAIQRILQDDITFTVIGSAKGLSDVLGESVARRVIPSGVVEFDQWSSAITQLGVGFAPTADTKFNAAKSWLKPLEYAATGVVAISSPREEYSRLYREHGIGLLAGSSNAWYRLAKRYATRADERLEKSERDRAYVRENLTIEGNAWRWMEAWETARLGKSSALVLPLG